MAQLIILLQKDFKNTLEKNHSKSRNIILPHILTSTFETALKPSVESCTAGLKGSNGIVEILPEDIMDSGSDEDDSSSCSEKDHKKSNNWNDEVNASALDNVLKKNSKDNDVTNISDKSNQKKLIMTKPRGKNGSNSKKQQEKGYSDADPFDDNSDDTDFEVLNYEKHKSNSKGFKKRKNTKNPKKKVNVQVANHSDESEYVPEEDSDSEMDLDWEAERRSSTKKRMTEKKQDDDPAKSAANELIANAKCFICTACKAKVKTAAEKEKHRKSHNLRYLTYNMLLTCPDCAYECNNSHRLRVHYEKNHATEGKFYEWKRCADCPFKTGLNMSLRQHLTHHKVKGTFQCNYCSFSHDHKKNVTTHLRLHNKFLTGIFRCEECSFATKHYSSIFKHKKIYHTPEEQKKWFHCKECPFKVLERPNLKKHINCHKVKEGYQCPHCTYRSATACTITAHIKIHYGKDELIPEYDPKMQTPLYSCPKCSYKTMTKTHLDRHLLAHQTYNDRRIKCADCPFTCKDKVDLITHMKGHNGEGDLKCPWCSFTHRAKPVLTRHKRLHNEEREERKKKKYRGRGEPKCPVCNERFQSPSFLKRHMLKHQTLDQVENPLMCAHCPYKNKTKEGSFITHIKCHFKTEGMKCDFCTYRHDRPNVMTIHKRLHEERSVKTEPLEEGN